jgi:hypothetical protein
MNYRTRENDEETTAHGYDRPARPASVTDIMAALLKTPSGGWLTLLFNPESFSGKAVQYRQWSIYALGVFAVIWLFGVILGTALGLRTG